MLPSESFLIWVFDVSFCKNQVLLVASRYLRWLMDYSNVWSARGFLPQLLLRVLGYVLLIKVGGLFSHRCSPVSLLVTSYYGHIYCKDFRSATHISVERDKVKNYLIEL